MKAIMMRAIMMRAIMIDMMRVIMMREIIPYNRLYKDTCYNISDIEVISKKEYST